MPEEQTNGLNKVELTAELTIAWLFNPNTRTTTEEVPGFLRTIHEAVVELVGPASKPAVEAEAAPEHAPAVTVHKSPADPNRSSR